MAVFLDSLLWMEPTQDPVLTESGCVRAMRKLTDQQSRSRREDGPPRLSEQPKADCMGFTANIYYSSGGWNVQGHGAARVTSGEGLLPGS